METEPLDIWVLTDGAAGNEVQALGLAEALARRRRTEIVLKPIASKPLAALLPARAWHFLGARKVGWPFIAYSDAVAPPWPCLVIGAGRRIAPLVAAMRQLHGVIAIQLLNPRMPATAFDLVIAPEHDRLTAANTISTLGAIGRVTPGRIAAEADIWRARLAHLPERRAVCLIGGPSKSAHWRSADGDRLVAQLATLSQDGWGLLITPSRRSDPALIARLKSACDRATTFVWDGTGENPYPGILGLAEAAVATGDSVNMVSEAASSGLPLHVFRVSKESAKLREFHHALASRGITRDFSGEIGSWRYDPLCEADRVAVEVERRLL